MPDVFAVLGQDHAEVKQMLAELENGPTRMGGASTAQLEDRKKLVQQLVIAESKHEAVEEEFFWPVVRDLSGGAELADHGTSQEQAAKAELDRLDKLDPADDEFEPLIRGIAKAGRAHIAFEEEKVWPLLRGKLSSSGAEHLGMQLLRAKDTAPTRPHPEVPPRPGILKATGPAAAAVDRLRDKITGRGKNG